MASKFGMLGSIDANTGVAHLGWDTDCFMADPQQVGSGPARSTPGRALSLVLRESLSSPRVRRRSYSPSPPPSPSPLPPLPDHPHHEDRARAGRDRPGGA
jgi:hypothetical protein